MKRWNLYATAVALAAISMPASGEIIFGIDSAFSSPGSAGTLEVDVQNTGGSSIVIGGFNFEIGADSDIDFTGAGFSTTAPYIFAGDSFDQINSLPLNISAGSSLSAFDISNSGDGDTLGAGQTAGLALVTFDVSPTAALGPVTVSFFTDPSDTSLSDQNGDDIPIDSFVNGTIDVIPEPSGAAMLLLGLGAWRLRLFRARP
ncbi:MAG: hypothetical protein ABSG03_36340 [Bryobacteraceae bacterium]|jgi:hypothetical protein